MSTETVGEIVDRRFPKNHYSIAIRNQVMETCLEVERITQSRIFKAIDDAIKKPHPEEKG